MTFIVPKSGLYPAGSVLRHSEGVLTRSGLENTRNGSTTHEHFDHVFHPVFSRIVLASLRGIRLKVSRRRDLQRLNSVSLSCTVSPSFPRFNCHSNARHNRLLSASTDRRSIHEIARPEQALLVPSRISEEHRGIVGSLTDTVYHSGFPPLSTGVHFVLKLTSPIFWSISRKSVIPVR